MAPVSNDIIRVTDFQTFLGQTIINTYFYRYIPGDDPDVDYSGLSAKFNAFATVIANNIQSNLLTHTQYRIENLTNGIDLVEVPASVVGAGTGDALPSYAAFSFRLNRTTKLTRHGQKRIAGLTEAMIIGNEVTAGMVTPLNGVADAMATPLVELVGPEPDYTYEPVIIGRDLVVNPETGNETYELNLMKINPVQSAQFVRLTTQTTRRKGRGA